MYPCLKRQIGSDLVKFFFNSRNLSEFTYPYISKVSIKELEIQINNKCLDKSTYGVVSYTLFSALAIILSAFDITDGDEGGVVFVQLQALEKAVDDPNSYEKRKSKVINRYVRPNCMNN